jgi:hypothetical protein
MCHSIVYFKIRVIFVDLFKTSLPTAYTRYDYKVMRLKKPPTTNTQDLMYQMSVVL